MTPTRVGRTASTRWGSGRHGRWFRLAAVAVALLVGVGALPSAAARPGGVSAAGLPTGNQPYGDCTDTDGVPFATGLPPLPCLPQGDDQPTRWQDFGAPFQTRTTVAKPRIAFDFPLVLGRTFFVSCTQGDLSPCPDGYDVPIGAGPEYSGWTGVAAAVYLQSPLGDRQQYGDFPSKTVGFYAFGSIPVTATVSVAQQVTNGVVDPLILSWAASEQVGRGVSYPDYPQYGASPYELSQFYPPAHVRGPITVTVSDVAVDGVPLDVGPDCRTTTDLDLTAPGGWVDTETYVPTRGQPGAYSPISGPPSYLTADLTLPPFSGCRGAREDVSRLVTGLVSGPHDVVDVTQTQGLLPYACLPGFTDTCYGQHPAVIDPRSVPVPAGG